MVIFGGVLFNLGAEKFGWTKRNPGRRLDARWSHIGLGWRVWPWGAPINRGFISAMAARWTFVAVANARLAVALRRSQIPTNVAPEASLTWPHDADQSYVFAPRFGRTLKELNHGIEDRISDHDPIIVDLPLGQLL